MNLFVSFFAYFIEDYYFPSLKRFQCAFCTGNLGRVDPITGRDDHDVLEQSFWVPEERRTACIQPGLRVYQGIEFFINGAPG